MQEDIEVAWESVRILLSISNIRPGRRIKRQELETDYFIVKRLLQKH